MHVKLSQVSMDFINSVLAATTGGKMVPSVRLLKCAYFVLAYTHVLSHTLGMLVFMDTH